MLNLQDIKNTESNFLKLIDIIPDAIVLVNAEGKIKHINSQIQIMFGYRADELMGKEIEILMPARLRNKHTKHREGYETKPTTRPMGSGLELYGRKKDGTEFPVDIMLSPLETEEGKLTISVIRDITVLKKVEEGAKRRAKQLEDLVSTMTHDLKTPLIAAETSFKHLLAGYFGDLTEKQKEILSLLIQGNTGTLRLVNNLLSVFKYESRSYRLLLEQIEVSELLSKAVDVVKPMLDDKKIFIKAPKASFKFTGDEFELERVIINLLTNSIRHTQSGGNIELRAVKNEEGNVTISVEDSGCGIAGEDLSNLFERFWQSYKSNASYNSSGLGLYLCRQIVEAHGGKIWAESKIGKGTKVSFEIPNIV